MDEKKKEIPLAVRVFADEIIRSSISRFKNIDTQFMPTAFLKGMDGNLEMFVGRFTTSNYLKDKKFFAESVKRRSVEIAAYMSAFVSEVYFLGEKDREEYTKNIKKYDHYMGNHPHAKEALMISIETLTHQYGVKYEITKDRTLNPLHELQEVKASGRFMFLPGKEHVS